MTVCALTIALICGPATAFTSDKQPTTEELTVHADKLFQKGEYDTALTVFEQLAATFRCDPIRLAAIQKKIQICEQAVHPASVVSVSAPVLAPVPAPIPADEVMTAAGRRPHTVPKPGEVLEMTVKALGNFEFNQEKGGEIPVDVKRLSGVTIRVRGWMLPLDQADNITQFAITPKLEGSCYLHMPLLQHTIIADCPKGKAVGYCPDEIIVEGILKVEVKKDEGYIIGIFSMSVTSVKPAPK